MKLITVFVICLVIVINGDSSRLLLKSCTFDEDCKGARICVNGQCAKQECRVFKCADPCLDPNNYFEHHCPDGVTCIAEAVIDPQTGCELCPRFKECSQPEPCPVYKCADPCLDPNNNFEPYCSDGVRCISRDVFDTNGCKVCPEFVECPIQRSCTTGCGKGWYCCNSSCNKCAPDGGFCTQQVC
eukprot:135974_1